MKPFVTFASKAVPLPLPNIDTDIIIPVQWCKVTDDSGFADGFFRNLRFRPDGTPDPACVFNEERYGGAEILLAGANFGCGSSREHAPWALRDHGIRCIVAPSFADIFYLNCFKIGLLPIVLDEAVVGELMEEATGADNRRLTVDLAQQRLISASGREIAFDIEPTRRAALLNGIDDLALTLVNGDDIGAFERRWWHGRPWLDVAGPA